MRQPRRQPKRRHDDVFGLGREQFERRAMFVHRRLSDFLLESVDVGTMFGELLAKLFNGVFELPRNARCTMQFARSNGVEAGLRDVAAATSKQVANEGYGG